jgi:hypothetical protein
MRDHVNVLGSHEDIPQTYPMTTAQTIPDAELTVMDLRHTRYAKAASFFWP